MKISSIVSAFLAVAICLPSCGGKTGSGIGQPLVPEKKEDPNPLPKTDVNARTAGSIRLATYNVGAFGKYSTSSISYLANLMNELDLDAISLNELDSCNTRGGKNVYQLKEFAAKLGSWNYKWGQALDYKGGGYGVGVATKQGLKVVNSWKAKLPNSDDKETRALAVIETEDFVICSTHLGLTDKSQADQIAVINQEIEKRYTNAKKPVFLCGDFNAEPNHANITSLDSKWERLSGTANTFSTSNPTKCIDYIYRFKSASSVRVIQTCVCHRFESGTPEAASDHYPVFLEVIKE